MNTIIDVARIPSILRKLTDVQLRQCQLEARYMMAILGNGVAEYRQAITTELQIRKIEGETCCWQESS